jgi:hypothetical protein
MNGPKYRRLVTALRRAVRRDHAFTERQRAAIVLLAMELMNDDDAYLALGAIHLLIEMGAANRRAIHDSLAPLW